MFRRKVKQDKPIVLEELVIGGSLSGKTSAPLFQIQKEFIGKVWEREIDYGNSNETIMVVEADNKDTLDDLLTDFNGKKVKITVEVIE